MESRHISSAEMTAFWRSKYSKISKDPLSEKLASKEGIDKALNFEEKFEYPLVGRKVSVRAGWCLNQAVEALSTTMYDSCISLGSGFSLLTYAIALGMKNTICNIKYIDIDLPEIVRLRKERIALLPKNALNPEVIKNIEILVLDLEKAYQAGRKFKDIFPSYESPVFIIEGIIYFLSKECVEWVYQQISEYRTSAVIFDYWPEEGPKISKCFKRIINSLDDFIPEKVKGLISESELARLCRNQLVKDISLQEAENEFSTYIGEPPKLVDKDEFIPVRLAVASYSNKLQT